MVGWDRDDCWFAHCVMLDAAERARFAARGLGVATCPASNARLASGVAPLRELLDEGVRLGLGVDGSASNDAGSLLAEARLALLIQRGLRRERLPPHARAGGSGCGEGGPRHCASQSRPQLAPIPCS